MRGSFQIERLQVPAGGSTGTIDAGLYFLSMTDVGTAFVEWGAEGVQRRRRDCVLAGDFFVWPPGQPWWARLEAAKICLHFSFSAPWLRQITHSSFTLPPQVQRRDRLVAQMLRTLADVATRLPANPTTDLYQESLGTTLALHLVTHHGQTANKQPGGGSAWFFPAPTTRGLRSGAPRRPHLAGRSDPAGWTERFAVLPALSGHHGTDAPPVRHRPAGRASAGTPARGSTYSRRNRGPDRLRRSIAPDAPRSPCLRRHPRRAQKTAGSSESGKIVLKPSDRTRTTALPVPRWRRPTIPVRGAGHLKHENLYRQSRSRHGCHQRHRSRHRPRFRRRRGVRRRHRATGGRRRTNRGPH